MENDGPVATIDAQFDALTERMQQHFAHVDARLDKIETELRHTNGQIERVRGEIRQVTETMTQLDSAIDNAREEPLKEIRKDKSVTRLHYQMLESRMEEQERKFSKIEARLSALENKPS